MRNIESIETLEQDKPRLTGDSNPYIQNARNNKARQQKAVNILKTCRPHHKSRDQVRDNNPCKQITSGQIQIANGGLDLQQTESIEIDEYSQTPKSMDTLQSILTMTQNEMDQHEGGTNYIKNEKSYGVSTNRQPDGTQNLMENVLMQQPAMQNREGEESQEIMRDVTESLDLSVEMEKQKQQSNSDIQSPFRIQQQQSVSDTLDQKISDRYLQSDQIVEQAQNCENEVSQLPFQVKIQESTEQSLSNEQSSGGEETSETEKFGRSIQYWLACIGYAVGFGNIWRFPYLVFKNGGAVFLIPYFIALFTIAIPMYMVETAYGQLIRCKLNQRFSLIHPALWGLGLCQAIIMTTTCVYYNTLMAWSLSYLFDSFTSPLPWNKKEGDGSPENAFWNTNYFHDEVLYRSNSISETNRIVPKMFIALIASYVIIYFSIWKGLKSSGYIMYITVPLPYILLGILLAKGLTLDGSIDGLKFLLVPEWSKLYELKVWEDAFIQILYSSGIAFGPLTYYASARNPTDKIIRSCFCIPIINSMTSIFASLTIFSFLGYVSKQMKVPISEISDGGLDLAFIAYPGMMTLLDMENLWSIIFFVMLITVGLDSIFGFYDFTLQYIIDFFPSILKKVRREIYVLIMTIFYFGCGIIFVLDSGFWIFELFNTYAAGIILIFILTLQIISFGWIFGLERLEFIMMKQTGEKFPAYAKFMIKYISPVVMVGILGISLYNEVKMNQLQLPSEILWSARSLIIFPMIAFLVGLVTRIESPTSSDVFLEQYGGRFIEGTNQFQIINKSEIEMKRYTLNTIEEET